MDWNPEQYERVFEQCMVWSNIVFYILIALFVLIFVCWFLDKIAQQKYYDTLSEEDKSVISKYNTVGFFNYKKKVNKV